MSVFKVSTLKDVSDTQQVRWHPFKKRKDLGWKLVSCLLIVIGVSYKIKIRLIIFL